MGSHQYSNSNNRTAKSTEIPRFFFNPPEKCGKIGRNEFMFL